uniref:TLC domain-containing protein n=1 Tax=Timema bartmani TaxID=61472 RepID=A0A7R9F302_9NEOP|nr:unnamed protein product [Timema bartmani]
MERKYNYYNIPPIVIWWVQVPSHEKIQIKKSFRKDYGELLLIFRASLAFRPLGAPTKYLRGSLGDCVFGFVYLMELSTPFVSFRGILSKLKMKSSHLYVVNGLAMLVTFFFCRVVMFPYVCYLYSRLVGLTYWQAIWSLPTGCKIGIAVLMLPQVYWFILMLHGAIKVFCPHGSSSSISSSPSSSLDSCCSLIISAFSRVPQTMMSSSAAMYSSYVQSGANLCHVSSLHSRVKVREEDEGAVDEPGCGSLYGAWLRIGVH